MAYNIYTHKENNNSKDSLVNINRNGWERIILSQSCGLKESSFRTILASLPSRHKSLCLWLGVVFPPRLVVCSFQGKLRFTLSWTQQHLCGRNGHQPPISPGNGVFYSWGDLNLQDFRPQAPSTAPKT